MSPTSPRVSIVIPTHDDGATLPRTVGCVLAQDMGDLEVVVVNDAGPAPAEGLGAGDPRLRVFEQPSNRGPSAARNRGMAETTGELLFFLDADDYVAPDLLSFAVERMADPSIAMLFVGHTPVAADRIEDHLHLLAPRPRTAPVRRLAPAGFLSACRTRTADFWPSAGIFRRAALEATLGPAPWEETLRNAEDTLLIMGMGARHGATVAEDRFTIYTRRPGSLSRSHRANWTGRLTAMDLLLERLGPDTDPAARRVVQGMRQTAARRVAGLLARTGERRPARGLLLDDLGRGFSWKSAAALLRHELRLR